MILVDLNFLHEKNDISNSKMNGHIDINPTKISANQLTPELKASDSLVKKFGLPSVGLKPITGWKN